MLKKLLLYLSAAGWARALVTHFPLARRVARRFVAGETLAQALALSAELNQAGLRVTLDYLGESVTSAEDTAEVVHAYQELLHEIQKRSLQAGASLKLTHLGLDISEALCMDNLRAILRDSADIPIAIDMESSAYTDQTLKIYRQLRFDEGHHNLGTVIQAYLYRSVEDMQTLAEEGAHIRLCKGAYLEPSELAYPQKSEVDAAYVQLMQDYLSAPPPAFLAIATHDEQMILAAQAFIKAQNISAERYEFQMLYGIRSARLADLAKAGYPTRVYVPFGSAWYPYFMRRLAERPANLAFFLRSLFGG